MQLRCRQRGFVAHAFALVLVLLLMLGSAVAQAQMPKIAPKPSEAAKPSDPYGRISPEGTVAGFVGALAVDDYQRASAYLDLSAYPARRRAEMGEKLASDLQTLLDRGGSFASRTALSNAAAGNLDDGLEPDLERVGRLRDGAARIDLLLERRDGAWLIASETLRAVPDLLADDEQTLIAQWLPEPLAEQEIAGAPVGHWLSLVVLAVLGYAFAWLVTTMAIWLDAWWCRQRRRQARSFLADLAMPLRLWLAVLVVKTIAPRFGLSIVAREAFGRLADIIGLLALAWLAWRIIDVAGGFVIGRLQDRGNSQIVSIATFAKRLVKAVVFAVGIMAMFDTLGYDITAGIAALGVGGLALALGAQKVIENLVAGVSVIADQPVRIGDVCKVGDITGTIEALGIRSAQIRTSADTLVTIPNSDFAAKPIENLSRRRKILFHQTIYLPQHTPPDRLRSLLERMRALLREHPRIHEAPPRVRLLGINNDRLPIEVFGYVPTTDSEDFLAVQEDLTLRLLELVAAEGLSSVPPIAAV